MKMVVIKIRYIMRKALNYLRIMHFDTRSQHESNACILFAFFLYIILLIQNFEVSVGIFDLLNRLHGNRS